MVEWFEHLSLDQEGLGSFPAHSNCYSLRAYKLVLEEKTQKLLIKNYFVSTNSGRTITNLGYAA